MEFKTILTNIEKLKIKKKVEADKLSKLEPNSIYISCPMTPSELRGGAGINYNKVHM